MGSHKPFWQHCDDPVLTARTLGEPLVVGQDDCILLKPGYATNCSQPSS